MEGDTGEKGNLQKSSGQSTTACKVDLRAQLQGKDAQGAQPQDVKYVLKI